MAEFEGKSVNFTASEKIRFFRVSLVFPTISRQILQGVRGAAFSIGDGKAGDVHSEIRLLDFRS